MKRKTKLFLNAGTSLLHQLITIICGFVLPHVLLVTYGSAVNGLISSITQFLGFISLCELGVGAVVQSALYQPLAENDSDGISRIALSSERFFKKIAYILLVYTAFLMLLYPLKILDKFDYVYTMSLVLVMAVSTFAQYYFGITYRLILTADQLSFVHLLVHSATLILNTVFCVFLARIGVSIHFLKLTTSLLFLLQPICVSIIAKRKYKIDRRIVLTEEPIKQKWNGLAQHIASVVLTNTDTVVLTLFSTLENVSIYSVYNLVVSGVKEIIRSLTNGIQALFGNMLAKHENEKLDNTFDFFEWLIHTSVTVLFSATALLIIPFVSVYTKEVADVDYVVPAFAYLITAATAAYCLRLPYNMMVLAAGHYKQTQCSAIIEAVLNIAFSIVLVFHFGIVGVAIGTVVAMGYRTIYFVYYLSKNILNRRIIHFAKHLIVDALSAFVIIMTHNIFSGFFVMNEISYIAWIFLAIKVVVLCFAAFVLINTVCYPTIMRNFVKSFLCKFKKNRT